MTMTNPTPEPASKSFADTVKESIVTGGKVEVAELVSLARADAGVAREVGANLGVALGRGGGRAVIEAYGAAVGAPAAIPLHLPQRHAYILGYFSCIRDVTSGYADGAEDRSATDIESLATWIKDRKGALEILRLAQSEAVICLSDVSKELGESQEAQWSRLMKELQNQRLLEPLPGPDSRKRPQALTLLGTRLLEAVGTDAEPVATRS